jgi:hypothetical protein
MLVLTFFSLLAGFLALYVAREMLDPAWQGMGKMAMYNSWPVILRVGFHTFLGLAGIFLAVQILFILKAGYLCRLSSSGADVVESFMRKRHVDWSQVKRVSGTRPTFFPLYPGMVWLHMGTRPLWPTKKDVWIIAWPFSDSSVETILSAVRRFRPDLTLPSRL